MRLSSSNPSQEGQDDWHLVASHGIRWAFLGRPPGPQTGLAKQAKHTKQHSSGPQLVPPLTPPGASPSVSVVANLLGSPRSFSFHPLSCIASAIVGVPRPELPLRQSPVYNPNGSAAPLEVMLLFSPFAWRIETDPCAREGSGGC